MTRKSKMTVVDMIVDTTDHDIMVAENEGMIVHDVVVEEKVIVPFIDTIVEVVPDPATEHTVDSGLIRKKSSFGKTMYYIDKERVRATKGPGQLLGIIKYMLDHDITSPENAEQGSVIGTKAVQTGYVATNKLTGPVIFAYYIRRMENEFGVEHAVTVHAKTGKIMN